MAAVSASEVTAIFDEQIVKYPDLAELANELKTYYSTSLWHQMTDSLMKYVHSKAFDLTQNEDLLTFYNKLILRLNNKLNPIKYALVTIACSRQHENIEDSIKFLEEAKDRLKNKRDAGYLLDISKAEKKLSLGLHHDCIEALEVLRVEIEEMSDVDPKVFSLMAHVFGLYYRRKEDHENYFKSILQYLAYTPMEDLTTKDKKELSIKVGMSILLGKNVFNIVELLDKELINSLVGTEFEWLHEMMKTLGKGEIEAFSHCVRTHNNAITKFPKIVEEMTYLEQKVRIIAFLEMIFQCNKDERSIPFSKIAATCQVEEGDVEFLVMKAMSLGLIRGTIDEVDQVVQVEWSQPRYLSKDHLKIMGEKMVAWELKLDETIKMVEANAQELVVS